MRLFARSSDPKGRIGSIPIRTSRRSPSRTEGPVPPIPRQGEASHPMMEPRATHLDRSGDGGFVWRARSSRLLEAYGGGIPAENRSDRLGVLNGGEDGNELVPITFAECAARRKRACLRAVEDQEHVAQPLTRLRGAV